MIYDKKLLKICISVSAILIGIVNATEKLLADVF